MKRINELKKEIRKAGKNIFMAYSPGYDCFFDELWDYIIKNGLV